MNVNDLLARTKYNFPSIRKTIANAGISTLKQAQNMPVKIGGTVCGVDVYQLVLALNNASLEMVPAPERLSIDLLDIPDSAQKSLALHFNYIDEVVDVGMDGLIAIDGIGDATATKILDAISKVGK